MCLFAASLVKAALGFYKIPVHLCCPNVHPIGNPRNAPAHKASSLYLILIRCTIVGVVFTFLMYAKYRSDPRIVGIRR